MTRIDPVSRRVVKTIGIGAPAIGLATGGGNVWVATGGFGTVVRIDSALGAVTERIELGNPGDPVVPTVSSVGFGDGRRLGRRLRRARAHRSGLGEDHPPGRSRSESGSRHGHRRRRGLGGPALASREARRCPLGAGHRGVLYGRVLARDRPRQLGRLAGRRRRRRALEDRSRHGLDPADIARGTRPTRSRSVQAPCGSHPGRIARSFASIRRRAR